MPLLAGDLACRRSRSPEAAWQPDGGWTDEAATIFPCVYFRSLEDFLPPSPPGFNQVRNEGSTGKYGEVSVSEAERAFSQADSRQVEIRIVDSSMLAKLADGIKEAAREASQLKRPEVAVPLRLPEALGYLRYEPTEEKAEANLLVGDRFVVSIIGRGFKDANEVRRIAERLDSVGLSKLR